MILKISKAFLFSFFTIQSFSQVDFGISRQKLIPTFFDTTKENVFIYEVPNAVLYFKQGDIKKFIENPFNKNVLINYGYDAFQDTLSKNSKLIRIRDAHFFYNQTQRDSMFKFASENPLLRKLNQEFYFIGAALILSGQFMVFSKANNKFITKKLIAKREKGYLGQQNLEFYLPDKKGFYSIVTRLGE